MAVPLCAVLEYLTAELLELGGDVCRDRQSETINIADIEMCVENDEELAKTFEAFSARHVAATLDRDDETPESDSDGASDGDYQDEDEDEDGEDDENEPEQRPHIQAGECPVQ